MNPLGLFLGLVVGFVLGLLGGGGSILALPIFLYVFRVETKPAVAMSLAVVGISAFIGFLTHWRQGTVRLRIAIPFGLFAMLAAFVTARLARVVPAAVQLGLFAAFAFTAAFFMLRDSLKPDVPSAGPNESGPGTFGALLAGQAIGVGVLTSLIGAGGGFVIVPALVLLAGVPVKPAVGSSLLIITMNSLSGFAGYIGQVPIDWGLIGSFAPVAAVGAVIGTRYSRRVPQRRIKQGFAILIVVLGSYLIVRRLSGL
ncbi:MAG: sulfite exporter TauE/SafE family protein [Gemmatimonadaceae bacterium]